MFAVSSAATCDRCAHAASIIKRSTKGTTSMSLPTIRIGSLVIHCHEFERMVAFWQQALHYVPREPPHGGWVVLRDPEQRGPNLSFQARGTKRPARNWLHLDLYTDNRDAEVERL